MRALYGYPLAAGPGGEWAHAGHRGEGPKTKLPAPPVRPHGQDLRGRQEQRGSAQRAVKPPSTGSATPVT